MGSLLPGKTTVPELIAKDKTPYYKALDKADECLKQREEIDVGCMEDLLVNLYFQQVTELFSEKTENEPPTNSPSNGGNRISKAEILLKKKGFQLFGLVCFFLLLIVICYCGFGGVVFAGSRSISDDKGPLDIMYEPIRLRSVHWNRRTCLC